MEFIENHPFWSLLIAFWALCLLIIGVFLWLDPKQIVDEDSEDE